MKSEIDLTEDQRRLVVALIERHLPDTDVWAHGSRVQWTSRSESDLDLVVFSRPDQSTQVSDLREAFAESDLLFRVDVLVWDDLQESFQNTIYASHHAIVEFRPALSRATIMRFGDCVALIRDHIDPSDLPNDTPYISLSHIPKNGLSIVNHGVASDVTSVKNRFKKGDILFGALRPYFRKVAFAPYDGICSTDIWVVRAQHGLDQNFLFYQMISRHFVDYASSGSEGTRMPRAKWDHVSEYRIFVPSFVEQQRTAKLLAAIDDKRRLAYNMTITLEQMLSAVYNDILADAREQLVFHACHRRNQAVVATSADHSIKNSTPDGRRECCT